jgi:sporulation protein YlmC with PRC-barrel domain
VTQLYDRDPLIHAQRLFVQADHGEIYLSGHATSADIRAAVEQIAANVPRVRAVINEVLAPGATGVKVLRAIELSIGQAVHASEMPIGRVERVVISPQQSRVTAFVAHRHLPDLARATPRMLPKEMPKQERRVVIPTSAVQEVTAEGVQLRVSGLEAARYSEFDPANFVASDIDWPALPAYRPADVLIDRGCAEARRQDLRPATSGRALRVQGVLGSALVWEYIGQGMPVACRDGIAGTVNYVRVDPDHGGVSQIVVGGGRLLPKDTLVPLDWIARIDEQGVFVNVGVAQLAALPAGEGVRDQGLGIGPPPPNPQPSIPRWSEK